MAEHTFRTYYLTFPAGLHISTGKGSYDRGSGSLYSDQLYAALQAASAKWGLPIEPEPPYVLSSAYPFFKSESGLRHFLPKPYLPFQGGELKPGEAKKLKKVAWLDQDFFSRLACGEALNVDPSAHAHGAFLTREKDLPQLITQTERLRTRVGREQSENTKPYYVEELQFAKDAGFYFIAIEHSEGAFAKLEQTLNMLADEGLGTDRSIGKGAFHWERGELGLQLPDTASHCTNLSLYCPASKAELNGLLGEGHQYSLIRRGGWMTSEHFLTYRKKEVHFLEEGGIFSNPDQSQNLLVLGKVMDLAPDELKEHPNTHPVWRNGRSLFIPLTLQEA